MAYEIDAGVRPVIVDITAADGELFDTRAEQDATGLRTEPETAEVRASLGVDALVATGLDSVDRHAESDRSHEVFRIHRDPETYEVTVESDVTIADYERDARPEDWALLTKYAEANRGKTVVFINPTLAGGGVAMMRPPIIHALRELGVDAHWFVMADGEESGLPKDQNPFVFTKQMHNITQRMSNVPISEEGKELHHTWAVEKNGPVITRQPAVVEADVIVIDDPQPVPMIADIKAVNPNAKVVWRNHIDNDKDLMADPTTPQGEVWDYLKASGLGLVDAAVFHPDARNKFVPEDIAPITYLAPATIEPNDDMNRELSDDEKREGIEFVNNEIRQENAWFEARGMFDDIQAEVDTTRDRIVLIARFDESKGMHIAMELGARIRQQVIDSRRAAGDYETPPPQVIIVGNGSVDDPSGMPMLKEMRRLRREEYGDIKEDIILKRLKHNYVAINALMYEDGDAVLIADQLSEAEGCETRITDWIRHGIPVIVSNRGGMSLQVQEGSGIVLDYDRPGLDLESGTQFASSLMLDRARYAAMRKSTFRASAEFNEREYTTTANLIRWLRIFDGVTSGKPADKVWKVGDMVTLGEAA